MSAANIKPYISSRFQDALNGEFRPASDPERTHRLWLLAEAAGTKGQFEPVSLLPQFQRGNSLLMGVTLNYVPSWARDVEATVNCIELKRSGIFALRGIALRNYESRQEMFVGIEPSIEDRTERLKLFLDGQPQEFTLDGGDSLKVAQASVTEAAKSFFSQP